MIYEIKLKTGFFKTEQYMLEITPKKIVLCPKEDVRNSNIVIKTCEISNISINSRDSNLIEIEIVANNGVYICIVDAKYNIDELIYDLTKELGRKLIIQ